MWNIEISREFIESIILAGYCYCRFHLLRMRHGTPWSMLKSHFHLRAQKSHQQVLQIQGYHHLRWWHFWKRFYAWCYYFSLSLSLLFKPSEKRKKPKTYSQPKKNSVRATGTKSVPMPRRNQIKGHQTDQTLWSVLPFKLNIEVKEYFSYYSPLFYSC